MEDNMATDSDVITEAFLDSREQAGELMEIVKDLLNALSGEELSEYEQEVLIADYLEAKECAAQMEKPFNVRSWLSTMLNIIREE
jgi:hypothetical protein